MQVSVLKRREAVCNHWLSSPHYVIVSHLVGQLVLGSSQVWWLRGDLHRPLVVGGAVRTGRMTNALSLLVDDVQVSRHVEIVDLWCMHTPGCLPPVGLTSLPPVFRIFPKLY
jgi:hypothetical protein